MYDCKNYTDLHIAYFIVMGKTRKKVNASIISWSLYDLANNSFAVIVVTVIFPLYFTSIIVSSHLRSTNFGDLLWGISNAASMLISSVFAPVLGAIADRIRKKRIFLILLSCLCILFAGLLFFTKESMIVISMIIFILANIFYQTSTMFHNAFLPEISQRQKRGRISGIGFSMGYLGGLLMLALVYPFARGGFSDANLLNIRFTFIASSLFFIIFAFPSFIFLKDKKEKTFPFHESHLLFGFKKIISTLKSMKKDKNLLLFLISFFLYSNAFSILAIYISIYAKESLGFSLAEIVILFILGSIPTIIGSLFFGWLADKIGSKNVITITLLIWIVIIFLITLTDIRQFFYLSYLLAAMATGSTLVASRSLMSLLVPKLQEAELFGFYAIGGKFSSILGPMVFALISYITKDQRLALLSTMVFLISGITLIQFVKVIKKNSNH